MENMGNGFVMSFLIISPVLLVCYVLDGPEQVQQFFMEWVRLSIKSYFQKSFVNALINKFFKSRFSAMFCLFFWAIALESSCCTWSLFDWHQICHGLDDCEEWRRPIQFRWLRKKLFCCLDNGCLLYSSWDCILCGLHRRFCQETKTKRTLWTSLHWRLLKINLILISFIIIEESCIH